MTVTVRLFASYAQSLGRSELEMNVESGATIEDVVAFVSRMPGAERLPPSPVVAVNCAYASKGTRLSEGDEVALIPPVAGG
jgi:molybdopterin converting factor small subunit